MSERAKRVALQRFTDDEILDLIPHPNLGRPHGTNNYLPLPGEDVNGRSFDELIAKYPGNFDPQRQINENEHAQVKILKQVYGAVDKFVQSFLGEVLVEPANDTTADHACLKKGIRVLAKVIDLALFEFEPTEFFSLPPAARRADSHFTSEGSALSHFYKNKLTGPDHIVPEFYGTWVLKVEENRNVRYVGIILMEFIQGLSMKALSEPDKKTDRRVPKENQQFLPKADGRTVSITLTLRTRLRLLKQLLGEHVKHLKAGIQRVQFGAWRIFITNLQNDEKLDNPRPVLLSHSRTQVLSLADDSDDSDDSDVDYFDLTKFSKPIHPFEIFDIYNLGDLSDWIPSDWVDNSYKYDGWLLLEFGLLGEDRRFEECYSTFNEKPHFLDEEQHDERKKRLANAIEYCNKLKQYALQRPETRHSSHKRRGPEQERQEAKRIRGDESCSAGRESLKSSSPPQSSMTITSDSEVNEPEDDDDLPEVGHESVHDEWFLFYNGGPRERSLSEEDSPGIVSHEEETDEIPENDDELEEALDHGSDDEVEL